MAIVAASFCAKRRKFARDGVSNSSPDSAVWLLHVATTLCSPKARHYSLPTSTTSHSKSASRSMKSGRFANNGSNRWKTWPTRKRPHCWQKLLKQKGAEKLLDRKGVGSGKR